MESTYIFKQSTKIAKVRIYNRNPISLI